MASCLKVTYTGFESYGNVHFSHTCLRNNKQIETAVRPPAGRPRAAGPMSHWPMGHAPTGIQSVPRNQFVRLRSSTHYYYCFQQALFQTLPYDSARFATKGCCPCVVNRIRKPALRGTVDKLYREAYKILLVGHGWPFI